MKLKTSDRRKQNLGYLLNYKFILLNT